MEHEIKLTGMPRRHRPRRQPLSLQAQKEAEIKKMLEHDIIEPANGPYASGVVLVCKPDGSVRTCIDYRDCNALIIKDSYPLPNVDDCFDHLEGAKWLCTADFSAVYY